MLQLWCLHGNLQQPTVWESTLSELWHDPNVTIIPVNLWSTTAGGFWQWAEQFCNGLQPIEPRRGSNADGNEPTHNVILGYSLGGRLALHAVLYKPKLWQGAIAITPHPGLTNFQDRQVALQQDQHWGQRFLAEPWFALLDEWDRLPVFNGLPCTLDRSEHHFSRQQIARLFDVFSKGRQDDLCPKLQALSTPPILYVSGELDTRYSSIGERLARDCSVVEWVEIAQAGHRVPWEQPTRFTHAVKAFLESEVIQY